MKRHFLLLCLLVFGFEIALMAQNDIRTDLSLTPDHFPKEGVPKGELKGPFEFHSKVFAGTVRRYWIYVPARYKAASPAALLVFQDGQRATNPEGSLRVPQVMENLMASGEMPVTIGLFITPGNTSEHYPDNLGMSNPNHRAEEYDDLDDDYSQMIIGEFIPMLSKEYNISEDPEMHAIGGTSSGAICAFTVAWRHPEAFRKVYSAIGSYVSIGFRPNETPIKLGGQDYPALIRREKIRPMKIFYQDGSNDLSNEWGNWFLANQQMVSAMEYANRNAEERKMEGPRYAFTHVWTDGKHSDQHPGMVLPEGLRWIFGKN